MKINKYWEINKPVKRKKYMTKKRILAQKRKEALIITLTIILSVLLGILLEAKNEFIIDGAVVKETKLDAFVSPQRSEENITPPVEKVLAVMIEPSVALVQAEIIAQSDHYGLDREMMLALADCESDFIWNAKNPTSTARGVYQYLIGTWEETESAKQGIERNNIEANITEAMLDVKNGESWRWRDCGYDLRAMGYNF